MTGRKELHGRVVTPALVSEKRGVVDYAQRPPFVYPYSGLFIYDAAAQRLFRAAF